MNTIKDRLSTLVFYLSILFFTIGFNFSDTPLNGWYQQFMPSIGGRQIKAITFLDSLNGFAVASQTSDSSFILRTTNSGDNWQIIYGQNPYMTQLQFLNLNTGYTCGSYIYKTINGGFNWTQLNMPAVTAEGISVLTEDIIWFVGSDPLVGGVYRTTNGGASWDRQLNLGTANPDHIYMFNERIGFISENGNYLRKTTDAGQSWTVISNNDGFTDIYFVDSLIGWKCWGEIDSIKHTTNGGLNWVKQFLPPEGGPFFYSRMLKFAFVNKDTIWGVGGTFLNGGLNYKGMIYKTIDGGNNWGYQLPDTNLITIGRYYNIDFANKLNGWAYSTSPTGVHTTTGGGDTTFYTSIKPISTVVPKAFKLFQNFPNPFNPETNIKYQITKSSHVILKIYSIQGKEIETIINQKQNAGSYEVIFSGSKYSSGVYFYSLYVDGKLVDTKKMILLK